MNRSLRESVAVGLGEEVRATSAIGGGSINDAWRVELESGTVVFVKSRAAAGAEEVAAEAAGLAWLRAAEGVAVPRVLGHGARPSWLALEWISRGRLSATGAAGLGRDLAALHAAGSTGHGQLPPASPDGLLRIGSVEIPLEPAADWAELYAGGLILPLVRRAGDAGRLSPPDAEAIERVCGRLAELGGPRESPARLHGDLWSGNVMADESGAGWLIDPAAYGGHREVDLAMLRLFGAPDEQIFSAYQEVHPLADGHLERVALWQLLPLLVHAFLFGGGYGASAGEAARRYL